MFSEQDVQAAIAANDFTKLMDGSRRQIQFDGQVFTMEQVKAQDIPAEFVTAVLRGCEVLAMAQLERSVTARDFQPRETDLSPHVLAGTRYVWLQKHDALSGGAGFNRQFWPKIAAELKKWMEA
jgi:hypothetical protein